MKTITVDAGKFNTKAIMEGKRFTCRTKLQEVDNAIYDTDSNTHHIIWKDKDYILGNGAKVEDYDTTKKKLSHKLATHISTSKLLDDPDEIGLVILSPLSIFTSKEDREDFRQYILEDNYTEYQVDGNSQQIILKDVTVFAEALGTAFANPDKFKNNIAAIIDIGGLNVNGIVLNSMTPIKGSEFTINLGSYSIMEKIKGELNKELKTNIQDYQMELIIKQGYYNYNKDLSTEIIQSILSDHFNEIINTMKRKNWDIKGLDMIATGGGALNLGLNNLSKYIPHIQISNDPIWDNCKGGQIVGEMIYD